MENIKATTDLVSDEREINRMVDPSRFVRVLVNLYSRGNDGALTDRGVRVIKKTEFGFGALLHTPGFYEMIDLSLIDAYWSSIKPPVSAKNKAQISA